MSIYKRGKFYWFEFWKDGQRFQKSTKQKNYKAATDIESAFRTELAKGDAGIGQKLPAPTLKDFRQTFEAWTEQDIQNPRTRQFYKDCFSRLLDFKPFADARLDRIDEPMIEQFKRNMLADGLSKTTVNRHLATLRKTLRYAALKLKLFDKLPVIEMYNRDQGAERQREFIFSDVDYKNWLAIAPDPLRSASILARNTGICRGEMLALQRDCITVIDTPDNNGMCGYMEIKRGLKRKERRRRLPVNSDVRRVLLDLLAKSRCEYVFTALEDATRPLSPYTLEDQLGRTCTMLKLHDDAGLHTLRHTFLTEMGRKTDSFTLQKIAGHARITTTQRYVHPQEEAIVTAFAAREKTVPTKIPTVVNRPGRESVYN